MDYTIIVAILAVIALIIGAICMLLVVLAACMLIFVVISVLIYHKTKKILIPKLTLFLLNILEDPVSHVIGLFIDRDIVNKMVIDIRNDLCFRAFDSVLYKDRFLFLPHCLRHDECPAKSSHDGILCVQCGKCPIGGIKKEAEEIGYKVFIVPGGSLLKVIVKKYKPKAVFGVGCVMEVKEGAEKMSSYGIPVQGFLLDKDGCISTEINTKNLLYKLK